MTFCTSFGTQSSRIQPCFWSLRCVSLTIPLLNVNARNMNTSPVKIAKKRGEKRSLRENVRQGFLFHQKKKIEERGKSLKANY